MKTKLIFVITDRYGVGYGLAPSKVQARRQIQWFLPKGIEYTIQPVIIHTQCDDDCKAVK